MGCMFCGESPVSREHVFTSWIREAFGPVHGEATHVGRLVTNLTDERRSHSSTKMLEIVGRRFCETCNNGWMDRADQDIRSVLEPMLHDEPCRLSALDQEQLTVWATKIVMVLQAVNVGRSSVVPEELYRWFHQNQRPLPGSHVWLFRYTDHDFWPFVSHQWGATFVPTEDPAPQLDDPLNGFSVVFTLGTFGVSVFDADLPGGPYTRASSDDQVRLIWPLTGDEVHWPPRRPVATDDELTTLARRMPGVVSPDSVQPERWHPRPEA